MHRVSSDGRTLTSYAATAWLESGPAQDRNNVQIPLPPEFSGPRRRLIDRVFRVIDENFRDPLPLRRVAAAVGHVPAYLTDVMRGATGRPVHKWIAERRGAEARHLLATSDEPIGTIARAVGFPDPAYFSRAFVRATGQSPTRWRRTYAGRLPADMLDAATIANANARIATLRGELLAADSQHERDEWLLRAARSLMAPLAVTMNHRDPATGWWYHHGSDAVAFGDADASIPLLLHGCASAELLLEHSYFAFYRRLAQTRCIGGFFKLPLIRGGVCVGALCTTMHDPQALTRARRYVLEELARTYNALGIEVARNSTPEGRYVPA